MAKGLVELKKADSRVSLILSIIQAMLLDYG
ncbi:hypothetical protein J2S07_000332 [Robertmurraya andreesenii]|uniref:Uncharacterized protein n=1 Tax=Anoxybacillus andreesenii TaxID=1325932 RepID=A0ABT9UZB1_9BACL|nr:hypothetical protein [Robertmurraya andreesenii]